MTTNPPKEHNFDEIPHRARARRVLPPQVRGRRRPRITTTTTRWRPPRSILAEQEANADKHIHMPSPSYWPIVVAFALPIMAYGVIFHTVVDRRSAPRSRCSACSAGRWSPRSPTTPTTTRRRPTAPSRRRWPSVADARGPRTAACTTTTRTTTGTATRTTPTTRSTGLSNNKLGDVAVPRLRMPAVRRPDLHLHAVPRPPLREPRARPVVGHPVHVGVELRAADELADDGARRLGGASAATTATPSCGCRSRRCSARCSSPARCTSSRRSTARVSASRPACSRRASTRSPASTACTCRSASSCCCRSSGWSRKGRIHGDKAEVVELIGLYWHFVDIVWILIFTLVYLIPA